MFNQHPLIYVLLGIPLAVALYSAIVILRYYLWRLKQRKIEKRNKRTLAGRYLSPHGTLTESIRCEIEDEINCDQLFPMPVFIDPASEKFNHVEEEPMESMFQADIVDSRTGKLIGWVDYRPWRTFEGHAEWTYTTKGGLKFNDPIEYLERTSAFDERCRKNTN